MLYFLFTTTVCNLKCSYCEDFPDRRMPGQPSYSLEELERFLEEDSDPVFVFYGGEPLVNIPYIKEVMDRFDAAFVLQTNATLLDRLPDAYLRRLDSILVSIDGRPETYDRYRGKGMYAKIVDRCKRARERGYQGNLVARMTVSSHSDIYAEVRHLLHDCEIDFDHVYWQLDAGFDGDMSLRWKNPDFKSWLEESYKPGLSRLAEEWLDEMRTSGRVGGIVPFLGILHDLKTRTKAPLRCGIGHSAFSITTDGKLLGCPVATQDAWNQLGDMHTMQSSELPGSLQPKGPCQSCDVLDICGGRCLIATHNNYWGEEGFRQVCESIRHLIGEMERAEPVVSKLLDGRKLSWEPFCYPATRYSLEVIP